ncbi:hypothetical protein SAMN05421773_103319 [Streptomyces aidingensis]|uniref:DUF7848 domain-containing protein n=2 Tax=Streptomyces aidingensis TaxID=910347 RepID=A0A1I1JFD2_9ACTN|nr:hypothetical protein SAMN05421773_103319 [Streptomyces aidingensis]
MDSVDLAPASRTYIGKTFRFRKFVIAPDAEPDAEPMSFSAECAVCNEHGPEEEISDQALAWIERHLKRNPEHLTTGSGSRGR